jgi:hypothetical protein
MTRIPKQWRSNTCQCGSGKQLIQPVVRLLVKNDDPDASLAGTAAIKWSQQPTSASPLKGHSK